MSGGDGTRQTNGQSENVPVMRMSPCVTKDLRVDRKMALPKT